VTRRRAAIAIHLVQAVVCFGFAARYALPDTILPYHADALGMTTEDLPEATRVLILALMDVAAAGWLALGVMVAALALGPFARGDRLARWLVPAGLLVFYVPTLLATLQVLRGTPADPPWYGPAVACAMALVALALDAPWSRRAAA
jgi:hypothetical protein